MVTLARGRWDGSKLVDVKDIFTAQPTGNASRILFARDGTLIMSVGYGDPPQANQGNPDPDKMPPQDPMNLAGKTLRLKDDGTVPPDNPFVGKAGYRPEIYTLGHRNILGLAMNPETGAIWSVENGPNGGDEVNELMPGKNYGWPIVNAGRFYLGPRVSVNPYRSNMEPPVAYWVPAIAASGLVFYTGDKFPQWKNNLFVGGMRQGEVPRSGHLERFDFNEKWEELHREGHAARLAAAHPRRAAGARRQSLSAHRGERRCADAHRTRQVGAFREWGLTPSQFFTHSGGQRCASFYLRFSSL